MGDVRRVTVALLAWVAGCSPSPGPLVNPDCDVCTPPSMELAALEGRAFLLTHVTFAPVLSPEQSSPGLDLDGQDSERIARASDCEEAFRDYTASFDPRLSGIDNAGAAAITIGEDLLPDRTFQGELDAALADGRIRWAIGIGEPLVDGPFSTVALRFYAIDARDEIATRDGRPLPGQTLRGRVIATLDASVAGSTAFGVTPTPITGVGGGDVYLLPLDDLELGGIALVAGPSPDSLRGAIGGSFTVDALVAVTARAAMVSERDIEGARLIFEEIADLDPSDADPRTCERVSVGFGFEAVPVTLTR